jgi:hypothetical protein
VVLVSCHLKLGGVSLLMGSPVFLLVKHQTPTLLPNPIQQIVNLLPDAF